MSSPRLTSPTATRRLTRDRRILAWLLAATMAVLAASSVVQRTDAAPTKPEGRFEVAAIDGPRAPRTTTRSSRATGIGSSSSSGTGRRSSRVRR
jgi:hypothetical protein